MESRQALFLLGQCPLQGLSWLRGGHGKTGRPFTHPYCVRFGTTVMAVT